MRYNPIKIEITDEMMRLAASRDKGAYNDRSFMAGAGNVVGFLGEYMTLTLRPDMELHDTFDYDILFRGLKIDVKTKFQGVPRDPCGYYEASVDVNSLHQNTDYYIFCRVYRECDSYPHGWVLGGISKKSFLSNGRRIKKGDKDGDNGYVVRQDCINIRYDKLHPILLTKETR